MIEDRTVYRYHPYELSFIDSMPREVFDKIIEKEFREGELPFENVTLKEPPPPKGYWKPFYSIQKDEWYYRNVHNKNDVFEELSSDGVGEVDLEGEIVHEEDGLLVIDNFYLNPEEVRNHALADHYNIWCSFSAKRTARRAGQKIFNLFSQLWGKTLYVPDNAFTGTYKMNLEDDAWKRNFIHGDMIGDVAGVLFLNEEEGPGLNFYKHKESGHESNLQVIDNPLERARFFYDGFHEDRWEITDHIEMKLNRLVLYKANRFHREANYFGNSIENARLTQTFFLKESK